jgi:hypothetical protein
MGRWPQAGPETVSCTLAPAHARRGEDFADGGFPGGGVRAAGSGLDLVAVAAAVFLLDHVAGCGQAGDDAVGAALGDVQAGRDVARPRALVGGMNNSARVWLVRKPQLLTLNSRSLFPETSC